MKRLFLGIWIGMNSNFHKTDNLKKGAYRPSSLRKALLHEQSSVFLKGAADTQKCCPTVTPTKIMQGVAGVVVKVPHWVNIIL